MPNRLATETSPYLLQHKDNPVDWWPWCEEAIAEAHRREVPIFLSVGYSACHWCHVMEHESFENDDIAAIMNEHFVNIKVDREERPDIDAIYMNAVQLMTGQGGWPMSVFMTPDGQPFFGGTYWPPTAKFGRPGFTQVLHHIRDAWANRREEVDAAAGSAVAAISRLSDPLAGRGRQPLHRDLIAHAADELVGVADRAEGGFGQAPKFPHAMDIRVLLRAAAREQTGGEALAIARLTLDKMAAGGIYDHLGGGFHRYSTDARWLAPHFEKMLYDQALLLPAYLEAWQLLPAGDASAVRYEAVIHETLDYLHREMIAPDGGYAATQDADTEGEEGKFFVWSAAEVRDVLGEQADLFMAAYDVSEPGNWEGHSILNRPRDWNVVAADFGITREELEARAASARQTLFETRSHRVAPGRDEKVLASWNGLMIAAAARCGAALSRPDAIEHAESAARFVLTTMRQSDGRLFHTYKDGRASINGHLDDYAAMIDGLAELYQASFDGSHLEAALELAALMHEQFADPDGGAYFYTGADHERLITRQKDVQDSAVPSSVALAATGLLKLGLLTGRGDIIDQAEQQLTALSPLLAESPRAAGQALLAADRLTGPPQELVIAGDEGGELLAHLRRRFLPHAVVLQDAGHPGPAAALIDGKAATQPTLYRCTRGACQRPIEGLDAAKAAVDETAVASS